MKNYAKIVDDIVVYVLKSKTHQPDLTEIDFDIGKPETFGQLFKYSTRSWVDTRNLDDFKSAQWATIKQAREYAEFGGFVWDGSLFDSDAISQQRIQGLVHIANLDPDMSVQWTLADNTVRTLTSADAIEVGKALAGHVNEAHMKARALREQIDAATTPEAVQAITWES